MIRRSSPENATFQSSTLTAAAAVDLSYLSWGPLEIDGVLSMTVPVHSFRIDMPDVCVCVDFFLLDNTGK